MSSSRLESGLVARRGAQVPSLNGNRAHHSLLITHHSSLITHHLDLTEDETLRTRHGWSDGLLHCTFLHREGARRSLAIRPDAMDEARRTLSRQPWSGFV